MRLTHYERYRQLYTPTIPLAQQLTERAGWDALSLAARHHSINPLLFTATLHALIAKDFEGLQHPTAFTELLERSGRKFYENVYSYAAHNVPTPTSPGVDKAYVVQSEIQTQLTVIWQTLCHRWAGQRVYEVSPGLSQRLAATELRGLQTDDLHLPYPSIYLQVPPEAKLRIWNRETDWHDVEGMYLTEGVDTHTTPEAPTRRWYILIVGTGKKDISDIDDALFYFQVPLPQGQPVTQVLDEAEEKANVVFKKTDMQAYESEWRKLFNWAMNAMVYATSAEVRTQHTTRNKQAKQLFDRIQKLPKGSDKRRRLNEELRTLTPMHRIILGPDIKPWTEEETGQTTSGRKLTLRILVQGHYRNQVHGPQNSLRKTIWIQPFWRGPEMGETHVSTHVLI